MYAYMVDYTRDVVGQGSLRGTQRKHRRPPLCNGSRCTDHLSKDKHAVKLQAERVQRRQVSLNEGSGLLATSVQLPVRRTAVSVSVVLPPPASAEMRLPVAR